MDPEQIKALANENMHRDLLFDLLRDLDLEIYLGPLSEV